MNSTRTRRTSRRDTRGAICAAALARFDEVGVASTGMDEIAAAAGLSRAALYYHFATKRDLVVEVLTQRAKHIDDVIREEIAFRAPTVDVIVYANVRAMELSETDPAVRHLASAENRQLTAELLKEERLAAVSREFWMPLLTAAREHGEIRDDIDLEEIMNWMVFLKFSLAAAGTELDLTGDKLRLTFERFLAPALRPDASGDTNQTS